MVTDRLIHRTTSLCRECENAVAADVVAVDSGGVMMRKVCPEHGPQEVQLSTDAACYPARRARFVHAQNDGWGARPR